MTRGIIILVTLSSFFIVFGRAQSTEKKIKAPNFSLKTIDGKVIELSKLKGKVVLVNFWATWCPPCRAEIPDFIEVYDAYKSKGFEIIGIALDEEGWTKVKPYMDNKKINYPIVLGSRKVIQQYGGIESIPTTFLIDKEGYIAGRQIGVLTKTALEKGLKSVLK